jgi:phosphoserine phosphatase RsbU/P
MTQELNASDESNGDAQDDEIARLRAEVSKLRTFLADMNALTEAMDQVSEDAELHELLSQLLTLASHGVRARDASLLVVDEDTKDLVFVISIGELDPTSLAWKRVPRGEGVAGWVADNRRATIVNHPQSDERFYEAFDEENTFRTDSLLAAPIIGGGRVMGVIELLNKIDGGYFSAQDQTMLTLACRLAGEMLFALTRRTLQAARIQLPRGPRLKPPAS